jgi:hypothetical protein
MSADQEVINLAGAESENQTLFDEQTCPSCEISSRRRGETTAESLGAFDVACAHGESLYRVARYR